METITVASLEMLLDAAHQHPLIRVYCWGNHAKAEAIFATNVPKSEQQIWRATHTFGTRAHDVEAYGTTTLIALDSETRQKAFYRDWRDHTGWCVADKLVTTAHYFGYDDGKVGPISPTNNLVVMAVTRLAMGAYHSQPDGKMVAGVLLRMANRHYGRLQY